MPDNPATSAENRVVTASRAIAAPAAVIFELIADPARHADWDGNGNIAEAAEGQRVRAVGDRFRTRLTGDSGVRVNHVVEFDEGHRIAWQPAMEDAPPFGQLWRWEVDPAPDGGATVTHTYDWTRLEDPTRLERARSTSAAMLRASLDRLATLAEQS
ncbi:SRPBCC family protein [Cumulibacter manganitolerans]|uniref:SRPBCC family protein n=1 Tax=Cumulibacter manganitolerans TaxID=1884992 RepID=UPI001296413D|nr:SRPBCC family protein [Cumulibacter manganitolerans]